MRCDRKAIADILLVCVAVLLLVVLAVVADYYARP